MDQDVGSLTDDAQSFDELLAIVRNRRRRLLVDCLADREPPVALDELATAVARHPASDDADRSAEEIAVTLHHAHLPKLADAGVLAYDPAEQVVTSANTADLADLAILAGRRERSDG